MYTFDERFSESSFCKLYIWMTIMSCYASVCVSIFPRETLLMPQNVLADNYSSSQFETITLKEYEVNKET